MFLCVSFGKKLRIIPTPSALWAVATHTAPIYVNAGYGWRKHIPRSADTQEDKPGMHTIWTANEL